LAHRHEAKKKRYKNTESALYHWQQSAQAMIGNKNLETIKQLTQTEYLMVPQETVNC